MKKLTFCLMALAMAASTMFTSCGDDDDDDNSNPVNSLNANCGTESFSTSMAAFYQSANSSDKTGTSVLSNIFTQKSSTGTTTIVGTEKGKQLAININGTTSGTYQLSVASNQTINNALIDLLSGKTAKEIVADAVKTDVLIIYRSTGDKEGDATYYFSTEATVSVTYNFGVYSTGTFSAKMRNKEGQTFDLSGSFNVFGKPVTGTGTGAVVKDAEIGGLKMYVSPRV